MSRFEDPFNLQKLQLRFLKNNIQLSQIKNLKQTLLIKGSLLFHAKTYKDSAEARTHYLSRGLAGKKSMQHCFDVQKPLNGSNAKNRIRITATFSAIDTLLHTLARIYSDDIT